MKLSEKILTKEDVKDILFEVEFEHVEDNKYWSCDYEEEVEVILPGNKLSNLIRWIYNYYTRKAGEYGVIRGKSELRQSIKSLLRI